MTSFINNMEKTRDEKIDEMYTAMFGDKERDILGVVQMNKEMWETFSSIKWIGKVATWLAIVLAGVGAVWGGITFAAKKIFH